LPNTNENATTVMSEINSASSVLLFLLGELATGGELLYYIVLITVGKALFTVEQQDSSRREQHIWSSHM